jgi:hypothetical protein
MGCDQILDHQHGVLYHVMHNESEAELYYLNPGEEWTRHSPYANALALAIHFNLRDLIELDRMWDQWFAAKAALQASRE